MNQIELDEDCRVLLLAAREISNRLGHKGIICSRHLLFVLLVNFRPESVPVGPDWSVMPRMSDLIAPPGTDEVVVSPEGYTQTTKRVLERAAELATEGGKVVDLDHLWAALREREAELVAVMLAKLGFTE